MSKPELLYFDTPGRAEPIRILFHIAGVDYNDARFPGNEWPTIKGTTPLGFVPVLKVDGKDYCQSNSLTRYAAKLAGWYPASELEALKCDMIAESLSELMSKAPRVSSQMPFFKDEQPAFLLKFLLITICLYMYVFAEQRSRRIQETPSRVPKGYYDQILEVD
jgi:glutathione S-transferase